MMRFGPAREAVLGAVRPLGPERVALENAAGLALAEDVRAATDLPAFACSAMDGWAVRADEAAQGPLAAGRRIFAGDPPGGPLRPRESARIFTGAPLPEGADAVVRQEQAREETGRVRFTAEVRAGDNVRPAGEDLRRGDVALAAGTRLGPRQIALLAALGEARPAVVRRPRVSVLSCGAELVPAASSAGPWAVRDANAPMIAAALAAVGAEPLVLGIAPDDPHGLGAAVREALSADAACVSGGASVGERDLVRNVLARFEVRFLVEGVLMKPGRPFAFGLAGGRPVFVLPGSPAACAVAFQLFVRPAVLQMMGRRDFDPPRGEVVVAAEVSKRRGVRRFLWAERLEGRLARPLEGQGVGQLQSGARADLLLDLPEEVDELPSGARVAAWFLGDGP